MGIARALALPFFLLLLGCPGVASVDTTGCDSLGELFAQEVWAPVGSVQCVRCHTTSGEARTTRLILNPEDTEEAIASNQAAFTRLAKVMVEGQPLLVLKPSMQVSHGGGLQLAEGSPELESLTTFAERARRCAEDGPCVPARTPARIRRLTRAEIDRSLAAVLVRPTSLPGSSLEREDAVDGYRTDASALRVTGNFAEQLGAAAEGLSAMNLNGLGDCYSASGAIDARGLKTLECLGKRAFRRPLSAEELADLKAVFDVGANEPAARSYDSGVRLVIAALLQAPSFLYRTELGPDGATDAEVKLTPYETASAISYLVTGGPPDAALLTAAERNELETPAQREAQVKRLYAAAEAKAQIGQFITQWLRTDEVDGLLKNEQVYQRFNPNLAKMMKAETEAFVRGVLTESDGTFQTLMTADFTWADAELGAIYGHTGGTRGTLARISLNPQQRSGLLTQAGLLATYADSDQTSPIRRGKLVRERILCQPLPPPPKELMIAPPAPDRGKTTRERFAIHSQNNACQGCHALIDPVGFIFENYDGIGALRATENGHPVDASARLTATRDLDGDYTGGASLARAIGASAEARQCFARNLLQFSIGRPLEQRECLLEEIDGAFAQEGTRIDEVLLGLVRSERFVMRVRN
jgi:hypothetical protein